MGLRPDIGQQQTGVAYLARIVKTFAPLLIHVHLEEYSGGGYMAGFCPVGMGVAEIEDFLKPSKKAGQYPSIMHEPNGGNASLTARETAAKGKGICGGSDIVSGIDFPQ